MRSRLTFANVTAMLALCFAISSGAYAVTQLPPGSVGTEQLQADAVRSGKVLDGSLKARDLDLTQLPAGPTGPRGEDGVAGLEVVYQSSNNDSGDSKEAEAFCPAGKHVTGGGGLITGGSTAALTTTTVGAVPDPRSWYVAAHERPSGPQNWALIAYAVCADTD